MGTEAGGSGKIKVDEHYPLDIDEPPPFDVKKIENIRSNVKFNALYQITKLLGDGKFGKVHCVIERATGLEFAAKVIKISKIADRAEVEREVSILTELRHPRIAQIYDAFYTTENDVVLIMEIVRGGELFDRVAEESYELSELAVVMIICQLCEAIDYIHKQNILHLDVKPENIMCVSLTGNRIKLIDFGLARHYDGTQELKYMAGTPEFAAPEVIKFEKLDYHTDMWSIGVITYILLSGYSPFLGDNIGETYCNVEKGEWEFTEEFDTVSPEAKDFVSKLIVYDQKKRMLPHECLEHPWIAKHRQKAACNSILEKPLNAPQLDNKKIMRYNTRRKFKRIVIYVKFLIEMNRLRNSLKTRMSSNGHKFFDPLLKMAEKKEMKMAEACNSPIPTTSMGMNSSIPKNTGESKRKGSEATQLSQLPKIQEDGSFLINDHGDEKPKKKAVSLTEKKTEARVKTKRDVDVEKTVDRPSIDEGTSKTSKTTVSKPMENGGSVVKKKKIRDPATGELRKSSKTTETSLVSAGKTSEKKDDESVKEKPIPPRVRLSKTEIPKIVEEVRPSVSKELEVEKENGKMLKTENSLIKVGSVDSTKENNGSIDGKSPTRQGGIRKREKPSDKILNEVLKTTTLLKTTAKGTVVNSAVAETAKPVSIKREKSVLRKKKTSIVADAATDSSSLTAVKTDKKKSSLVVNGEALPILDSSVKVEQKKNVAETTSLTTPQSSVKIRKKKSSISSESATQSVAKIDAKKPSTTSATETTSLLPTAVKLENKKPSNAGEPETFTTLHHLMKSEKKKVSIAPEIESTSSVQQSSIKLEKKKSIDHPHSTTSSQATKKHAVVGEPTVLEPVKEKRVIKKHQPSGSSKESKEIKELPVLKNTNTDKLEVRSLEKKVSIDKPTVKLDSTKDSDESTTTKKVPQSSEADVLAVIQSLKKSSIKRALAKSNLEKDKKETDHPTVDAVSKPKKPTSELKGADTPVIKSKMINGDKPASTELKKVQSKESEPEKAEKHVEKVVLKKTTTKTTELGVVAPKTSSLKKALSTTTAPKEVKINSVPVSDTSSKTSSVHKPGDISSSNSDSASVSTKNSSEERKKVRFVNDDDASSSVSVQSHSQGSPFHLLKPVPLFGSGLQKMKSESCIHSKTNQNGTPKRNRDDSSLTRKGSLYEESGVSEEFSYENLRDKLNRRVSGVDDDLLKRVRKPINIPPTNSVKDRLKHFEKKFSK